LILRTKPRNRRSGFEAKPLTNGCHSFDAKLGNPRFSSPPCVCCGSHTASLDLPIIRPSSTRLVSDHPRSFTPSLLLLPRSSSLPAMSYSPHTHHETSKHVSPNRITQFGVSSIEIHRIQIQTRISQLLITHINQGRNELVSQNHIED
jgi:hypothetical protein